MLNYMRAGAQSKVLKFILFGILLLATFGLTLFGVQDMFRRGFHSDSVASIGHDKISKTDLDNMVLDTIRQKKISREDAYRQGIPMMALQREINSRIFIRAANDMGIIIDDATVRRQIDSLLKPMMEKGLTERAALDNILYSFNTSEGRLVASMKAELAVETLSHALSDGASAPQQLVDDFMKYRYEWRRGEYIRLTDADASVKEPTDDELKQFYQAELQSHYMQPEYRSFSVLVLDSHAVAGADKKPTVDAKAFYEQNKAQFSTPEKRTVSEIAVSDEALAQALYKKAAAKKDLKSIAAEAGKDKAQFTSDTYTQDSFIPEELAADVFKAGSGATLPPAKGPFGKWFIVHVDKVIPAATKPFEEVKADIEKALAEQNSGANSEALENMATEVDEMIGGGKSLAEVAQHYNLKTIDFDKVDSTGNDTTGKKVDAHGLPDFDKVLKTAWATDKGMASQPAPISNGAFVVVEVHDIQSAQARPFDAVRADVLKAWKARQASTALDTKAAKIMERLNMGESLEKVAADLGKIIEKTPLTQRETAPQKGAKALDPGITPALFSIDKVGQATAVPSPGSVTILRLAERKVDMSKPPSKEDVESMQAMLSQTQQSDILEQYRESLMKKYDVKIDEEKIKQTYAPEQGAQEDIQ